MTRTGLINLCVLLQEDQTLLSVLRLHIRLYDIWVPCRIHEQPPTNRVELFPIAVEVLSKYTTKLSQGRIFSYGASVPGFVELDHYTSELKQSMDFWQDLHRKNSSLSYFRQDEDRIHSQLMQSEALKQQQQMASPYYNPMYGLGGMNTGIGTQMSFNSMLHAIDGPPKELQESKDLDTPMLVKADKEVKPFKFQINE